MLRHAPEQALQAARFISRGGQIATAPGRDLAQGESNALDGRSEEYGELLPAVIRNWREGWRQGDFPFLVVQLANINYSRGPCQSFRLSIGMVMVESQNAATIAIFQRPSTFSMMRASWLRWKDVFSLLLLYCFQVR